MTFARTLAVLACLGVVAAPAAADIRRMSVSTAGAQANGPSDSPSINGTGRFVVFASAADNLVAGDTNGLPDIFLRDRDTDADGIFDEAAAVATTRLNLAPGGVQANNFSYAPKITPDGRYVCFISKATNLADTPVIAEVLQVYRLDRQTGTIIVVSVNDAGVAGDLHSREAAISDDGAVIAFSSEAGNLVSGPQSPFSGIYVREVDARRTTRLSAAGPAELFAYTRPSISGDGRRVVYHSEWPGHLRPLMWLFDREAGSGRLLTEASFNSGTLAADGTHAVLNGPSVLRVPVDLGSESSDTVGVGADAVLASSRDARYLFTTNAGFVDADLGVSTRLFLAPVSSASFDRVGDWLAVEMAYDSALPGGGDTNQQPDILVIWLPQELDVDSDQIIDSWETFFDQHDWFTDPDGDGQNNRQEFQAGTHPNGRHRRFLAEGATGAFFTTDIALANAGVAPARALLTFTTGDGRQLRRAVGLPAGSARVIHAGSVPGLEAADFSTEIESDVPIAVSRTMTWDTQPGYVANRGYASHMESAVEAPSPTWFFAEGSTVLGFDLFYLLQNPQAAATHATVRFLLPGGATVTRAYDLAPHSRTTIYVNQVPGLDETDVSGDIQADAPIVAERAMYRSLPGQPFALGHGAMGVPAAGTRWFLAEGATGPFFDEYVLIANPSAADAAVAIHYATGDGRTVTRQHMIAAHSRFSIFVDAVPGLENASVATTVTSTNDVPIVVERAMYWPGGFFDYYEGHASAGSTIAAPRWVFAGGESGGRYQSQTYVLVANTSAQPRTIQYAVVAEPGTTPPPPSPEFVVPPNSRTTLPFANPQGHFGVVVWTVGGGADLVVEGAVYRTIGGVVWKAGGDALATPMP